MTAFSKVAVGVVGSMLLAVCIWAAIKFELVGSLFSTNFLPHQYCYLQQPALVWTNAVADGVIWLAYVAIAIGLAMLLKRTESLLRFRWVFIAFGLFIVACGFTHFMEAVTVWKPLYWLASSVKVVTALASLLTAIAFVPLVPEAAGAVRLFNEAYSKSEEQRLNTLSKLLDTEEQMKLAFENTGVATWERSLVSKELHWDEHCRAVFGVPLDRKLYYDDFLKHIHPDDRASTQEFIESSIRERNEYTATFRIIRDDGEVRTVISRGKAFSNSDGKPIRLVGVLMDITKERQAQEALAKAEKFAVAGRMAASIAHEINNPLDAASGRLYLCRIDNRLPEDVKEELAAVEQELQRAGKITRSTLSFYRESPVPKETNLAELVDSVLEFQQARVRKSGIAVQKKFNSSETVVAYSGELRQIFTNLIGNALDAMGTNGVLKLRVHAATDWRTSRKGYRVTIGDTGPGIPTEARRKLFNAFYSTKGEKETGLGLWITEQLVRKHEGNIRVKSRHAGNVGMTKRTGTVFSVWLPLRPELHDVNIQKTA
jgi:PAS domain S-box-containing protein